MQCSFFLFGVGKVVVVRIGPQTLTQFLPRFYCARAAALYRGAVSETHKPAVTYRPPSKRRRTGEQVKEDMSVLEVDGSMTVAPPMMAKDQGPATLWERPKAALTVVDLDPWLRPVRVSQQAIKPPALHTKKEATAVPAVETPESGVSYNPAYMAHQKVGNSVLFFAQRRCINGSPMHRAVPLAGVDQGPDDRAGSCKEACQNREEASDEAKQSGNWRGHV